MIQKIESPSQICLALVRYFLISCTSVFSIYWLYFHYLSPIILSLIHPFPLNEYMPWVRWAIKELGGLKPYVLYVLMFANLLVACVLNKIFCRLSQWFLILLLPFTFAFLKTIGFFPPMMQPMTSFPGFVFIYCVLLNTILFSAFLNKSKWVTPLVIFLLLIVCLSSASGMSRLDYSCILSPAMRLLHGFAFNKTFFLYDYFLSILAALWMKFHLSIWTLPILGRLSFWVMLSAIFLFTKKYFMDNRLAVFLVISLTILKIYGNTYPPDFAFEVTPLRLDLWLVILLLAFGKGGQHWVVGGALGALIILHHVFGTIYAISYFMFIFILFISDVFIKNAPVKSIFKRYFSLYSKNLLFIAVFFLIYNIFFAPHQSPFTYFLKLGIAFMPIATSSFYWYFPVIFSLVLLLLLRNKSLLSPKFFETGILLITLTIGSSMYFLGRSHENNIINIAGSLLITLFLLLDLINFEFKKFPLPLIQKSIIPMTAMLIVLIISYFYADRASAVAFWQWENIKNGRLFYKYPMPYNPMTLKTITHNNPKVLFISENDFFYYYEGGYNVPDNFQCNLYSWYILKDYVNFINDQLNNGYYIVIPKEEAIFNKEIITQLNASHFIISDFFLVLTDNAMEASK